MKTSVIFFIVAGILLIITISPYVDLVPQSFIGVETVGVKIFAETTERNTVMIFLTLAFVIIGAYFKKRGQ